MRLTGRYANRRKTRTSGTWQGQHLHRTTQVWSGNRWRDLTGRRTRKRETCSLSFTEG